MLLLRSTLLFVSTYLLLATIISAVPTVNADHAVAENRNKNVSRILKKKNKQPKKGPSAKKGPKGPKGGKASKASKAFKSAKGIATWQQLGSDIDGEAGGDWSGYSVSLSSDGTVVAIGAPLNDGTATDEYYDVGHVRVYEWNSTAWVQRGTDIDGEAGVDWSGYSVSLSSDGTVVAIGAIYNDGTATDEYYDVGHVRVYEWNSTAWVQRGTDIDGEAYGDYSGHSVSLSNNGNVVAIGAWYSDGTAADDSYESGHVRVFKWDGSDWNKLGSDIDGSVAGDNSGKSVSLSADGTTVAIGAPYSDGTAADDSYESGHVRVYEWDDASSDWQQKGGDINGEAGGDYSGYSVSLSSDGSVLAIGAWGNDATAADDGYNAGHVRVYEWNGSAWVQRGEDIDGEAGGDESGTSVSLSGDGEIVAIGAPLNDANFTNAGHVRVYEWNSTAWVQLGNDIDGEAGGDESGVSVSLSSDGSVVAIGAYWNDDNSTDGNYAVGHVRVYNYIL